MQLDGADESALASRSWDWSRAIRHRPGCAHWSGGQYDRAWSRLAPC